MYSLTYVDFSHFLHGRPLDISRVPLEMLTVAHVIKKFPLS